MSKQRKIKVERALRENADGKFEEYSKIRLQGKWLRGIFSPGTHVVVNFVVENGKRILRLEEATEE